MPRTRFSDSEVERLIGRVYDMALEPELSESVVTEIGDLMGGAAAVMGYFEVAGRDLIIHGTQVRVDAEVMQQADDVFSTPESNPVLANLERLPRRCSIPLEGLVEPSSFRASTFHECIFRPQRWSTCLYSLLQGAPKYGCLAVYAFEPRREFAPEEVAAFERLIPHVTRSLQIRQRLLGAEQERFGATEALNRLPFGVVFLGFERKVLLVNEAAEAILNRADGLNLSNNRLRAATGHKSAELNRTIGAATMTAAGQGESAGGTVLLPRPSGLRPLAAQVMPLRYGSLVVTPQAPAAVVFIADPDAKQELPETLLSRTFGLTRQQAALASLVMEGRNLKEAAERLGVSRNTAHSHLMQIYQKTETHRQSELVRLLLSSVSTLRQG